MCLAEQDEMNQQLQRELAAARGVSGSPDEQATPQQATPQQATPQQATPSNGDATPLTASFLQVDTASIVPEDLFMKTATDSAVPSSLWSS
jgi:hypothetical protein